MTIEIEALTFDTIIGILDFERTTPQTIVVTCTIEYRYLQENFINYAEVVELIESTCKSEKFELLEEAIATLSQRLKERFAPIKRLYIKIEKPHILPNCRVGVAQNYNFLK